MSRLHRHERPLAPVAHNYADVEPVDTRRRTRSTLIPMGQEYDGDETTGETGRATTTRRRSDNAPTTQKQNINVWNSFHVKEGRILSRFFSTVALVILLVVLVLWLLGLIPGFPQTLTGYGFIFFILCVPVYIIGVAVPSSEVIEWYALSLVLQIFSIVVISYVFAALVYNWVVCIDGSAPPNCVDSYLIDTIMTVLVFSLWVCALVVIIGHSIVVTRVSKSSSVNKRYRPVN